MRFTKGDEVCFDFYGELRYAVYEGDMINSHGMLLAIVAYRPTVYKAIHYDELWPIDRRYVLLENYEI